MRVTENRKLALAVCIICALVSIFGIGGIKLNAKYSGVEDAFVNGADERHNMEYYLDRCVGYASDLAYEAMQYLEDDSTAETVLEFCDSLSSHEGPADGRWAAYNELCGEVDLLYSELQAEGYADETAVKIAYYDFQSTRDMIKRDEYHAAAAGYNDTVDAFPANLISGIWGIGEAEVFDR